VSREALSLEISNLVSRVVSGESIDIAERGAALAAKYPELGMSGELISQAIERAAGMVGMIKSSPQPPKMSPITREPPAPEPQPRSQPQQSRSELQPPAAPTPTNGHRAEAPSAPPLRLPRAVQLIDDDLAAAIDREIGNLVSGQKAAAAVTGKANGRKEAPANTASSPPSEAPAKDAGKKPGGFLRRTLFRT
jgi:hypothetical protein